MADFIKKHSKIFLSLLLILIFVFSFSVHYSLYRTKGYVQTQYYALLLAKNWAETGNLSYESQENVVLSTENIPTEGVPTNLGNKVTYFLYGFMFRLFDFRPELPMYTAFILYSLSAVLIFLTARKIFDLKTGLIAAVLINIAPYSLPFSQLIGFHEWAWFFLCLGSFFYFWPEKRKLRHLALSGLFLGLSAASKNSFFVAFPAFLILDFWREREIIKMAIKRTALLLLGFLAVFLPLTFIGGNVYLSVLLDLPNSYHESFTILVHLFPDPYTFHYDKENFISEFIANKDNFSGGEFRLWGDVGSFLEEYGYKIGFFKAEIVTRLYSIWIYGKGLFLSLVVFGGFLSWFLIALGAKKIKDGGKSDFLIFSAAYFVSWFSFLVFLKTSNYNQLLILSLPACILMSAGLVKLSEIVSNSLALKKIKPAHAASAVILVFLIIFSQITWWSVRELSTDFGFKSSILSFARAESAKQDIEWKNVTMTGWSRESNDMLAYYINKDFIYFHPDTVKKLAEKKKLAEVMKKYNISGFIGFDAQISETIKKNTNDLKEYKPY